MTQIKHTVIQSATDLFAKKGCKVVTMDDIAKSVGMSKRTIYENFKDKEELLTCCLNLLFEEVDRELDKWEKSNNIILSFLEFKDSTTNMLHRFQKDFFTDVKRYFPNVYANTIETRIGQDIERTIFFLEKGQKEGYFLNTFNTNLISILIQEVGRVVCDEEVFPHKQFKEEDLFRNGMMPYLRGISTQKGIETIDKYYNLQ